MGNEIWVLREKGTKDKFLVHWEEDTASSYMLIYPSRTTLPEGHILLTKYEPVRLEVADD